MSRVYFHSPSATAELRGSERAWLSSVVSDLAVGVFHLDSHDNIRRLRRLLHPDHYLAKMASEGRDWMQWTHSYGTALRIGSDRTPLIQWKGTPLSAFSLVLNTACLLGNDQVRLAARIHGQCEIHAWVDGPNRAWLADIMQAGVDSGVYRKELWYEPAPGAERERPDQGWGDVIGLLRERDDEPVVMSYSVCDGFPDYTIGDWMPAWPEGVPRRWDALTEEQQQERNARSEAWYDLDDAEKWRISMAGLRSSGQGLEIQPDDWNTFRFTHELSAFDLYAHDWQERLDTAVERMNPSGEEG